MINKSQNVVVPPTVAQLSEALCVVVEGLQEVLQRFDPQIALLLSNQLQTITLGGKDPLGLGALGALLVLSKQNITDILTDPSVSRRFYDVMKPMMALYTFENVTDDLCVVEVFERGTRYKYASTMRGFYLSMEELIEGQTSLAEAIPAVRVLHTENIHLPYMDRLLKLFPMPDQINSFFVLHLLTVAGILEQLETFQEEFVDLRPLVDKARIGLLNRYRTSRVCIDNLDVSVSVALERGKETIFTDFHTPYVMLCAAAADPQVRHDLVKHVEAVLISTDHSSYLHRIFNEAGISGMRPDVTLQIFAEALDSDSTGMTPRAYIKQLIQTATPETRRQIARLIKDTEEQEANLVLDSYHRNYPQPSALLRHNLLFLNRQLTLSLNTLKDALSPIEHPYIGAMISNFLEFQRSIYSVMVGEGGEYVGARETLLLNGLEQILNAEYPLVFIDRLIVQSFNGHRAVA